MRYWTPGSTARHFHTDRVSGGQRYWDYTIAGMVCTGLLAISYFAAIWRQAETTPEAFMGVQAVNYFYVKKCMNMWKGKRLID